MVLQLYNNNATLVVLLGGRGHRHIRIIMGLHLYAMLSAMTYMAPADPGALPILPGGATAAAQ